MDLSNFWWQSGAGGSYVVGNSLRFRGNQHLTRTLASDGSSRASTLSTWIKLSDFTNNRNGEPQCNILGFQNSGTCAGIAGFTYQKSHPDSRYQHRFQLPGIGYDYTYPAYRRDPSAWYHLFATASNNTNLLKFYVNGVEQTYSERGPSGYHYWNTGGHTATIGGARPGCGDQFGLDGYMSEIVFIDGTAHDIKDFGEFNADGVWVPKNPSGLTYGPNGWHLDFSDPSNIGKDSSGNNNHFTPTGFQLTDSTKTDYDWMKDSPTDNYPTLNAAVGYGRIVDRSEANLRGNITGGWEGYPGSQAFPSTGKWYCEYEVLDTGNSFCGIYPSYAVNNSSNAIQDFPETHAIRMSDNNIRPTGSPITGPNQTYAIGDILGVAFNADSRKLQFYKNGTLNIDWTTSLPTGVFYMSGLMASGGGTGSNRFNWGQRPFKHTPPAGFKPLSTAGLPDVPIKNPSDHFTTILDSGANILTKAQAKFPNGLWWIKDRANANQHQLVDSVNGTTKVRTCPGNADAAYVAPAGNSVAWCWATPASGINTTAGFSITNGTHGLGVAPDFIIDRALNVYHKSLPAGNGTVLNTSNGYTGQTWTVNATTVSGPGGGTYYSWAEVPGYSAFGSYVGNGNADGPFIYTGFRPAFVLIKYFSTVANHGPMVFSSEIDTYNPTSKQYLLSSASSEGSRWSGSVFGGGVPIDILSNGFKCRGNHTEINNSGTSYWYAAWAEHPFGGGNVSPAPAR